MIIKAINIDKVLTLGLIHLAFNIGGMHRVGLHVMTTLDIADVVMYLAKGYHLASSDLTGTSYTGYELCQFFAMGAVSNTWMVFFSLLNSLVE